MPASPLSPREDIRHIALMKSFCLLCVIAMHALIPFLPKFIFWKLYAAQPWPPAQPIAALMFCALIPAFMFASGYLLALSRERDRRALWQQVVGRGKRLLLPWLLTMLFWLVPTYWFFDVPAYNRPLHASLLQTYEAGLLGLFTDHLWFLLVLFWVTLFWLFALPLTEKRHPLVGGLVALGAGLLMDRYGGGLVWYCLRQTGPLLLPFYVGVVVCRYRVAFDRAVAANPFVVWGAFAALSLAALYSGGLDPRLGWLLSSTYCVGIYAVCLVTVRRFPHFVTENGAYLFFERRAFRFYLFHMPSALLIFQVLNEYARLSPGIFIVVSFAANMLVTTGIVQILSRLQHLWRALYPAAARG